MTPRLPAVSAKELVRIAERLGFILRRQRGSHAVYVRAAVQVRVVIPINSGDLKLKTLRSIIQDLRITLEEFRGML